MYGHGGKTSLPFDKNDIAYLDPGSRAGFAALCAAGDELPPEDRQRLYDRYYPDSILVWPHRDPADQFLSNLAIISITRRATDPRELREIFDFLLDWTGRCYDNAVNNANTHDGRIVHIQFSDLNRTQ